MITRAPLAPLVAAWGAFETRHPRAASLAKALAVAFLFGVLITAIYLFRIETRGFLYLTIYAFGGFLVHSQLPLRWRLPFFALLSLGGLFVVLDPPNALWLIGSGLGLIGICHLPIPFAGRAALLLAAGAGLAAMRGGWLESFIPNGIWPILGSIFMFRLIVYLYDLKHQKAAPSLPWALSYFFLLPNVCFPLFPVVDYTKFRATYYNEEEHRIYLRGIHWILRGVVHLILYRFVYYHVALDPNEVAGAAQLVQYMLGAFLLYLRISGHFHLIVGLLLLFGFNLPETHHLYYFAASFTDFWCRINIYWKDFMMKIFYYPIYFRLRKLGAGTPLVLATAVVFGLTWLLHAYQWFWLRGSLFLEAHDMLFWGILGVLVIVNSLHEQKHGRRRSLGKRAPGPLVLAAVALRTAATFTVICVLWSLWTADHLVQWFDLWGRAGSLWAWMIVWTAALYGGAAYLARLARRAEEGAKAAPAPKLTPAAAGGQAFPFWRQAAAAALPVVVLCLLGFKPVYARLPTPLANKIDSVRLSKLNRRDTNLLERGYYEQLTGLGQHNAELYELYNREPANWDRLTETEAWKPLPDMSMGELKPNVTIQFKDVAMSTNRWGFRDKDYEQEKPAGAFRIAVMGASHVFGSGVGNGENFESLLEDRLNQANDGDRYTSYEVLNFGVPNRSAVEDVYVLATKVLSFQPDAVIHFSHIHDLDRLSKHIPKILHAAEEIPYDYLREAFRRAGVDRTMSDSVIEVRIRPYCEEILAWAYRQFVEECRKNGARPIWVLLPRTWEHSSDAEAVQLAAHVQRAKDAGFIAVNIFDTYDGHELNDLRVRPWDFHPNRFGHGLLAGKLYAGLSQATDFMPAAAAGSDMQLVSTTKVGGK